MFLGNLIYYHGFKYHLYAGNTLMYTFSTETTTHKYFNTLKQEFLELLYYPTGGQNHLTQSLLYIKWLTI